MTAWLAWMRGLNCPIPEAKSSTILTIAVRQTWERSDEMSRVTSPTPGGGRGMANKQHTLRACCSPLVRFSWLKDAKKAFIYHLVALGVKIEWGKLSQ